ncbi:MAG: prephenate dehydratase [Planctomycetota bacterium]|jgi:chorismate mutase/prephenate dehydratase
MPDSKNEDAGLTIDKLRQEIDKCDVEIVKTINKRAEYAKSIGKLKSVDGASVYAPHREHAVYKKVAGLNQGPLTEKTIHAIYREIMSGTISLEGATRISYLGPPGTFSHLAALNKFGESMDYVPASEIRDVFLAVSRNHADYGIVPIVNSTEGAVTQTSNMFIDSTLNICSEIYLEIHQNLLANCDFKDIHTIISHPQPLAQCRNWIASNFSGVEIKEAVSTAKAAEVAASEDGVAAIASEAAAAIYDLRIIEERIEDRPDNVTRFVVLAHEFGEPTGSDKTSILFSLTHEAGSLADNLLIFKDFNINLSRIESHPCSKRAWEYTFFVDFEGHVKDSNIEQAMQKLKEHTHDLIVLGSYPRAQQRSKKN